MIGRSPTRLAVALAIAGGAVLSGCATFSDQSVAIRVGDDELTEDQLAAMLREATGDDDASVASMQQVNEILNNFAVERALRADLAAGGSALPEPEGEPTYAGLQASTQETIAAWQAATPTPIDPETLRATYALGPVESNIACVAHILVETEDLADDLVDQLADGADFAALAAEHSTDPGSADQGGALPCDVTSTFASQYIPEFVDAALAATIGEPVGPIASTFGYHIIVVREFDDVAGDELDSLLASPAMRFANATADLDVYVNPRYGAFDPVNGVLPLG